MMETEKSKDQLLLIHSNLFRIKTQVFPFSLNSHSGSPFNLSTVTHGLRPRSAAPPLQNDQILPLMDVRSWMLKYHLPVRWSWWVKLQPLQAFRSGLQPFQVSWTIALPCFSLQQRNSTDPKNEQRLHKPLCWNSKLFAAVSLFVHRGEKKFTGKMESKVQWEWGGFF